MNDHSLIAQLLNEKDLFARHCGMSVISSDLGYALAQMEISDMHRNSVGVVHGGAIFTLADFAFACAANSFGFVSLAINASIQFHQAARTGRLIATARIHSQGSKLSSFTIEVDDDKGNRIATCSSMAYNKKQDYIAATQAQ